MKDPMGTWTVTVTSENLTEKGWERLQDAIQDADVESLLNDAVMEALGALLPRDFDNWYVRVKETVVPSDVVHHD